MALGKPSPEGRSACRCLRRESREAYNNSMKAFSVFNYFRPVSPPILLPLPEYLLNLLYPRISSCRVHSLTGRSRVYKAGWTASTNTWCPTKTSTNPQANLLTYHGTPIETTT